MLFSIKKTQNVVRMLILGAPLMLAACHSDLGPFPMPSGYKHHDKYPQSPPGPEPVMDKIHHHLENMQTPKSVDKPGHGMHSQPCGEVPPCGHQIQPAPLPVVTDMHTDQAWIDAASDLVRRMTDSFGQPTEPVFIEPAPAMSVTDIHLEKALRHAMKNKGYNLAPAPGMGPYSLSYSAAPLAIGDGTRTMININLLGIDGEPVVMESGVYSLGPVAVMHDVPTPESSEHSESAAGAPVQITPNQ